MTEKFQALEGGPARDAFDAYVLDRWPDAPDMIVRTESGAYRNGVVDEMWAACAALAAQPQPALDYQQANPLGGPAKVFRAMADAIEAGDSYEDTLRRYRFAEAKPAPAEGDDLSERGRRYVAGLRSIRARHALSQEEHGALTVAIEVMRKPPEIPTNEALEQVASSHQGHPADFAADVLERWGGWQHGLMGYCGGLNAANPDVQPKVMPVAVVNFGTGEWHALLEKLSLLPPGTKLYTSPVPSPAVGAGDERQDIGGHIRAAANAKVAQQADDDTRRLDHLQKTQATISLVPDGRDENGTRHSFMVGGWHCSVNRDVRAAIDAAMAESRVPVQPTGAKEQP